MPRSLSTIAATDGHVSRPDHAYAETHKQAGRTDQRQTMDTGPRTLGGTNPDHQAR